LKELNQKIDFIPMDKWDEIRDVVQQAKAMEKEQIISAIDNFSTNQWGEFLSGEEYYEETYGSKRES
jgi:hypothetical protein